MKEQEQPYDALKEFVKILSIYMKKFGLEAIDIAFLAYTTRINIESLLNLKGSLELPRMEAIAQSFNLHHYQFSNPEQEVPNYESLPERTKKRIEYRKKKGSYVPETKNSLTINEKIVITLSFLKVGDEFLTEHIVSRINYVDADTTANTSLVGDRLAKSFSKYAVKTTKPYNEKKGKGAKPTFYKLILKMDKNELKEAINAVGDYWHDNYKKMIDQENE